MTKQTALLKLFNAVEVDNHEGHALDWHVFYRMVKNGYICESSIKPTNALLKTIDEIVGVGGEKLNSSFHKSWGKVANASMFQLVAEQIFHYITTYGFESLGIYDADFVYVPAERLDVPELTEDLSLVYIRGLTSEEILLEIVKLGSSGIALSQETLDNVMVVVNNSGFDSDFVSEIKNRELYTLLCDYYEIVPTEPMQYLRYLIAKLTGESLVIKNAYLIGKIKQSDRKILDNLLEYAPDDLASIFFRFKPLFLAMKAISKNKTFFNQLRRQANYLHKPLNADYLNGVTAQIKNGEFSVKELRAGLTHYSIWRKIRLANALNNRLNNNGSIVYKIRNGKGWATDFYWNGSFVQLEKSLSLTVQSIADDIAPNVNGKTFYIPSNVHYALPATEKQFTGNVPSNTFVSVPKDLVVGVHWYNGDDNRVDIDLSLLDIDGKYGWDRRYRNTERTVLFSGDMTDAPRPNGATELFYIKGNVENPKLIMANYYNFNSNYPVDCQLVVASERVSKNFGNRNYMINPNNLVMSQSVLINKKQNTIGLIMEVAGENRVYFSPTSIGNSITSRNNEHAMKTLDFFVNICANTLELKDVLEMAGATVVDYIPDEIEYVDLSPQALDKNTIIGLLTVS